MWSGNGQLTLLVCLALGSCTTRGVAAVEERRMQLCGRGDQLHTCLHGGTCVHDLETRIPMCDCSTAVEENPESSTLGQIQYAGRFCEIPVVESAYCSHHMREFCLNDGQCRTNSQNFHQKPCHCPPGFGGKHCEFTVHRHNECTRDCSGAGECHHGVKLNQDGDAGADALLANQETGPRNHMYCACMNGFAGDNCQYKYTACGGEGNYCFHGATCEDVDGVSLCQCEAAEVPAVGPGCRYRATDMCDNNVQRATGPLDITRMQPREQQGFCVNGGICVKDMDGRHACECDSNRWTGVYCEEQVNSPLTTDEPISEVERTPPEITSSTNRLSRTAAPTLVPPVSSAPPVVSPVPDETKKGIGMEDHHSPLSNANINIPAINTTEVTNVNTTATNTTVDTIFPTKKQKSDSAAFPKLQNPSRGQLSGLIFASLFLFVSAVVLSIIVYRRTRPLSRVNAQPSGVVLSYPISSHRSSPTGPAAVADFSGGWNVQTRDALPFQLRGAKVV